MCERLFVYLFLATNAYRLRQCATVDCAHVHKPSFPFEISEKDVFYQNIIEKISVAK